MINFANFLKLLMFLCVFLACACGEKQNYDELMLKARKAHQNGEEKLIIKSLNKAISEEPKREEAYGDLINFYLNKEDYKNMFAVSDKFVKSAGTRAAYSYRGAASALSGDRDSALKDLKVIENLGSDSTLSLLDKASLNCFLGDYDKALFYTDALHKNLLAQGKPAAGITSYFYTFINFEQARYAEALKALDALQSPADDKNSSKYIFINTWKAKINYARGDYKKALFFAENAVKIAELKKERAEDKSKLICLGKIKTYSGEEANEIYLLAKQTLEEKS
ncbi:tetratricopeptide (TPR) repeat protein [Elusimicrobium posterum]|uniref:hypothetical protein n=1 Tax=Elusimicrobium posterum TaxID=3116653 RepID=UPI003C74395A